MLVWFQLESSVISAAAYRGNSLYIRFTNNHEYEYYNVERRIYQELMKAPSAGQYFNSYIKDKYFYRKIY